MSRNHEAPETLDQRVKRHFEVADRNNIDGLAVFQLALVTPDGKIALEGVGNETYLPVTTTRKSIDGYHNFPRFEDFILNSVRRRILAAKKIPLSKIQVHPIIELSSHAATTVTANRKSRLTVPVAVFLPVSSSSPSLKGHRSREGVTRPIQWMEPFEACDILAHSTATENHNPEFEAEVIEYMDDFLSQARSSIAS